MKSVKDFPKRAKIEKNDRAGSVEKVKNGKGGGLSQNLLQGARGARETVSNIESECVCVCILWGLGS